MQVIRQNHHRIDMKWMSSFYTKQHRTQNSDVICQQRANSVRQIHREEIRPARDISPSITH